MRTILYKFYYFITIFILTVSNCLAYVGTTTEHLLETVGYVLLLGGIIFSYLKSNRGYIFTNTSKMVVLLLALMLPGIMMSDLTIYRKLTVVFTIVAIIIVSTISDNYIKYFTIFRTMAYACFAGVIVSTTITVLKGISLFKYASEPTFGLIYCFNGGIRDKNVATMMISIIMSIIIYSKEMRKNKITDFILLLISSLVIVAANSRGAWIELAIFVFMLNYKKIEKISKKYRESIVLVLLVIAIPIVFYLYNNLIMKSETYLYRYRGLINYISMFRNDKYILIFGNPELAYGTGLDYATAVRSVTGWNGTIENAWLNILIKSGILGVSAYLIIFIRATVIALRSRNIIHKTISLSVIITLFISSFVAIYIQTVHGLFGIYCYLIIGFYSGLIKKEEKYKGTMWSLCSQGKISNIYISSTR